MPESIPNPTPVAQSQPATPPSAQVVAVTAPTVGAMLLKFCLAIRDYEGKPGDLNYMLNNPLDCRPSPVGYLAKYQPVQIIDTNTDPQYLYHKGKFAKFKDYATGWEYGLNMVHFMAVNHPTWTLADFFNNFAPSSDSNNPNAYANSIAKTLGTSVNITLQELLG